MLENLGKRHIEIRFKTIRLNEYRKSQDSVLGKKMRYSLIVKKDAILL